jgi:hypothetical protein
MAIIGHGSPWSERKGAKTGGIHPLVHEIRHWREQEYDAGRPSGLEDYFRAHGLCFACKSSGTDPNATGLDGDVRLYSDCEVCGGTGKLGGAV